jgi:hypothetical protein
MLVDTVASSRHMFENSKSSIINDTVEIVGDSREAVVNDIVAIDTQEQIARLNGEEKDANHQNGKGDTLSVTSGIKMVTMTKNIGEGQLVNLQDTIDSKDKLGVGVDVNNIGSTTSIELNKQQSDTVSSRQEASKEEDSLKTDGKLPRKVNTEETLTP